MNISTSTALAIVAELAVAAEGANSTRDDREDEAQEDQSREHGLEEVNVFLVKFSFF